tara:strand:- start:182 stop:472 length:291 start_codon:yes stop_codon:yes gene_type:complete
MNNPKITTQKTDDTTAIDFSITTASGTDLIASVDLVKKRVGMIFIYTLEVNGLAICEHRYLSLYGKPGPLITRKVFIINQDPTKFHKFLSHPNLEK